ncbi:hypothetical protein [Gorillibacterium sp. sgz5001074]|uniref:hypothetical protein n=1 Tax=Gorillibacterium sp. sgz5001074 TaxID=3446695 RepID=UPI003F66532D
METRGYGEWMEPAVAQAREELGRLQGEIQALAGLNRGLTEAIRELELRERERQAKRDYEDGSEEASALLLKTLSGQMEKVGSEVAELQEEERRHAERIAGKKQEAVRMKRAAKEILEQFRQLLQEQENSQPISRKEKHDGQPCG